MTFEELRDFLASKMKMSHIYQPLLIKTLIESGGVSTIRQLATAFLSNDESQIMFYEKRLKEMPIKVLTKHGIISRNGELVSLNIKKMSLEQKAEIKKLCEQKIQEYIVSWCLNNTPDPTSGIWGISHSSWYQMNMTMPNGLSCNLT